MLACGLRQEILGIVVANTTSPKSTPCIRQTFDLAKKKKCCVIFKKGGSYKYFLSHRFVYTRVIGTAVNITAVKGQGYAKGEDNNLMASEDNKVPELCNGAVDTLEGDSGDSSNASGKRLDSGNATGWASGKLASLSGGS
jgi:hypothetical protein